MPLSISPLNIAAPAVPVVAVLLLAVAPVGLAVAVTSTPLWLTTLPLASCSWTTGCWASGTPLDAAVEAWVVRTSWVAAPALSVTVPDVTGVSPVAPKLKV